MIFGCFERRKRLGQQPRIWRFPIFQIDSDPARLPMRPPRMRSPLKSEIYEIFLEEFLQLRANAGLSQTDLADKLGIGQDVVSRCESGRRRIDVLELQQWAFACGSSLLDFSKKLDERVQRNRNPDGSTKGWKSH